MLGLMTARRNTDHISAGLFKYSGHVRRFAYINTALNIIVSANAHTYRIIITGHPFDLLNQFHDNAGTVLQAPAEFIGSLIKLGG